MPLSVTNNLTRIRHVYIREIYAVVKDNVIALEISHLRKLLLIIAYVEIGISLMSLMKPISSFLLI